MKKGLFLMFTLAIPVAIFLFLKIFGSNEFVVPILFENGISGCKQVEGTYRIPEFEYIGETEKNVNSKELNDYLVFAAFGDNADSWGNRIYELARIQDAFYEVGPPKFILIFDEAIGQANNFEREIHNSELKAGNYHIAIMENNAFDNFLKCGIALTNESSEDLSNFVLVDKQKHIRGIYNALDMEQTDQLILELKILKQKN